MICPKCGYETNYKKFCDECGVDKSKYILDQKIKEATELLMTDQIQEADVLLFKLKELYSSNPDVLTLVGLLHLKHNNKEDAKSYLVNALNLDPKNKFAKELYRSNFPFPSKRRMYIAISILFIASLFFWNYWNESQTSLSPNIEATSTETATLLDQQEWERIFDPNIISEIGQLEDPNVEMIDKPDQIYKNTDYFAFNVPRLNGYMMLGDTGKEGIIKKDNFLNIDNTLEEISGLLIDNSMIWTKYTLYELSIYGDIVIAKSGIWIDNDNFSESIIYSTDIVLPKNLTVGLSWYLDGGTQFEKSEIIGFANVTTQMGNFEDCLVVQTIRIVPNDKNLNSIRTDFYYPYYGLVKSDVTMKKKTSIKTNLISRMDALAQ
ncbi:MAG: hypothetical protein WDZ91_08065 [Paenibacillaceae bacterium]